MGGYIAFEIVRLAPGRVAKLALLDTGPGAEVPERTAQRKPLIELAREGRLGDVTEDQFPWWCIATARATPRSRLRCGR